MSAAPVPEQHQGQRLPADYPWHWPVPGLYDELLLHHLALDHAVANPFQTTHFLTFLLRNFRGLWLNV